MLRWRITRITGGKAVPIASVDAPDAETAIKRAIEQYAITDPDRQKRLSAYRVLT